MVEKLDETTIAESDLQAVRAAQRANDVNFLEAYNLPQLPEADIDIVFERLTEAERTHFSPNQLLSGYRAGTATGADEILTVDGQTLVLTAEHATNRMTLTADGSKRVEEDADHGTGALGLIVSQDLDLHFLAPIGRQTRNANQDEYHPLKDAMRPLIAQESTIGHLSIHGMFLGRVRSLADMRGFNVILGIGKNPSDETKDAVDKTLDIAKKYDLRAGVNQTVVNYNPAKLSDGSRKTSTLSAGSVGTTRFAAQKAAESLGKPLVTMQLEINQALRLLPEDHPRNPGPAAQRIGAYLSYRFVRECAELFV